MKQLSILIPARSEMWLAKTVEDILQHSEADIEILIGLDGEWADPGIPDDDRIKILYYPKSIGQRAMTNQLCRLSTAKYVMKIDAHCSLDQGFDRKMLEAFAEVGDNVTMAPMMRNLHAFDWLCAAGHRRYQGPSGPCLGCGEPVSRDILWKAKESPRSTSYRFDKDLHFQYFNEYKKKQKGDLVESMSMQGSCFMLTREKYWELDICDEQHGSWGQQGTEVACKTWLSGGRIIINKKTWYAHLFRTQGGDFGFPYKQDQKQVDHSRQYSKKLFLENTWPKAIHPLQWLVDKFAPVPGWHENMSKGIIYYTDNRLNTKIAHKVQDRLKTIGLPIVSVSLKPMPHFGQNIHLPRERGYETYFKQILTALEASTADVVYFCEHDNLMHPSHFDFWPAKKDVFYYDRNWWKIRADGLAVHWDADQLSGLCCYRETALKWYRERVATFDAETFDRKFEPQSGVDSEFWFAEYPSIDIRHDKNLTYNKWTLDHFRKKDTALNFQSSDVDHIPGWSGDELRNLFK